MARKRSGENRPRTVWSRDLAPLVTAARSGASHAARTARQERQQARRKGQWWRQRWLYVTATGVVVAGAAGGVYQAVAKRRRATPEQEAGAGPEPTGGTAIGAIRSTVDTSRERVTGAARGMLHRIRREEEPGHPERVTSPPDGAAGTPDQAPDQTDVTRGATG